MGRTSSRNGSPRTPRPSREQAGFVGFVGEFAGCFNLVMRDNVPRYFGGEYFCGIEFRRLVLVSSDGYWDQFCTISMIRFGSRLLCFIKELSKFEIDLHESVLFFGSAGTA